VLNTPVVHAVNDARLMLQDLRGLAVSERRRELVKEKNFKIFSHASGASVKRAAWGVRSRKFYK